MRILYDEEFRFAAGFDPTTCTYYRTSVRDPLGEDTGREPFMASFPHLLEVGIMGHCIHGLSGRCAHASTQCYWSGGSRHQEHMSLPDFADLAEQCAGRTFRFVLGGRGDPDQHEEFPEMLRLCREHEIIPSFATSGRDLDRATAVLSAQYCETVAVSWQGAPHTLRALDILLHAGATTNIHFLLGRDNIDEALRLLRDDGFPKGIDRVIFLLHQPMGAGGTDNVLGLSDPRMHEFFAVFNEERHCRTSGFDSCSVPSLLQVAPGVRGATARRCEAARFSAYVSPAGRLLPCSFDVQDRWAEDLRDRTVEEAWKGKTLEKFRQGLQNQCSTCARRGICLGGCPIVRDMVVCADASGGI